MRPKIKGDTFYVPFSNGIYLRNNQGSFTIKGATVYRWIERLTPYLNGKYSLEEITEGLSADRQAMVNQLVDVLLAEGFLKDVTDDQPHTLSEVEEQLYAPEIAFIDAHCNSAVHRFERYRQSRILLIGSGLTLTALVHAALKSGVRQVAVLATDECPNNRERFFEYLALFNGRGARQSIIERAVLSWDDEPEIAGAIQAFDVIIHVSDRPMLARANMLNRLCLAQQQTLIQAVIVDDHAWIGPLVHTEAHGCWECCWRRLQANLANLAESLPHYDFQDDRTRPISGFITAPTAAIISNQLSFEIFKHLTGVGSLETAGSLLNVDLETLQTESHTFLPHPLCSACQKPTTPTAAEFLATIEQLQRGEPLEQQVFSQQSVPFFNNRLGLFNSLDEHRLVQMPLNVSQVVVSNPMLLKTPGDFITVVEAGTDFSTPRYRATRRACELYAASVFDRRRLSQFDWQTQAQFVVQADWLPVGEGYSELAELTWAYNLHTEQVCLVPAALIYSVLRGTFPSHESAPGLASGLSWAEAVSRALLAYCKALTIRQIGMAQEPFPQIRLSAIPLDAEGTRYSQMLDIIDTPVTVYDVTGSLRVPTFAFCLGEATIAYSCHVDGLAALRNGLEQVVQQYQAAANDQPEYALPPVPDLPESLRGKLLIQPEYATLQDWSRHQVELEQTLHEHGYLAFAVPLDHDTELARVLPYIVQVILARA